MREQSGIDRRHLPHENVAGHLSWVEWIIEQLPVGARVLEVGCGTGYRVSLPLVAAGFDVQGIDLDGPSIEYGRELYRAAGVDIDRLSATDINHARGPFDAIVVSEVLEHLPDADLDALLEAALQQLVSGGTLLVTVPNGYGWFELESFLWFRTPIGFLMTHTGLAWAIRRMKQIVVSGPTYDRTASTLSTSPHVQRFTLRSIRARIAAAGFRVRTSTGSVLVCGPFSDLALTGSRRAMALNKSLGRRVPALASGFYVAAQKP